MQPGRLTWMRSHQVFRRRRRRRRLGRCRSGPRLRERLARLGRHGVRHHAVGDELERLGGDARRLPLRRSPVIDEALGDAEPPRHLTHRDTRRRRFGDHRCLLRLALCPPALRAGEDLHLPHLLTSFWTPEGDPDRSGHGRLRRPRQHAAHRTVTCASTDSRRCSASGHASARSGAACHHTRLGSVEDENMAEPKDRPFA